MRFQEMPITPELDEMQRARLVWYRSVNWGADMWDLDDSSYTPSYWEEVNPGVYRYAVRLEE